MNKVSLLLELSLCPSSAEVQNGVKNTVEVHKSCSLPPSSCRCVPCPTCSERNSKSARAHCNQHEQHLVKLHSGRRRWQRPWRPLLNWRRAAADYVYRKRASWRHYDLHSTSKGGEEGRSAPFPRYDHVWCRALFFSLCWHVFLSELPQINIS